MFENIELLKKYMNYWTVYPDRFIDTILPVDSKFNLYLYQRIILRALMRYRVIYIGARAPERLDKVENRYYEELKMDYDEDE